VADVQALGAGPLLVTEADRASVVRAEDLGWDPAGGGPAGAAATLVKRRTAGGVELRSECDRRRSGAYLLSTVTLTPGSAEARLLYASLKFGGAVGIGVKGGGDVRLEPRDDLLSWGDDSHAALISFRGRPVGNVFIAREGPRVFQLMVVGRAFPTAEALGGLLRPKLAGLGGFGTQPPARAAEAP
jgi:hypothetical protein